MLFATSPIGEVTQGELFVTIQEQITRTEPTPEQLAYRALIASFKTAIKEDAISLRREKRMVRDEQRTIGEDYSALAQMNLSTHRVQARARHLIYGTLRGRTRDQMEPKHKEKNSNLHYWIAKIWNDTQTSVPMPAQLNEFK